MFGLLAVNQESSVFAWIFAILNSLQVGFINACVYVAFMFSGINIIVVQHTILSQLQLCLQGMFIFIFYVIRDEKLKV